jgi:hypothetical protein
MAEAHKRARRNPKYKTQCRVDNRPEHEASLRRRGDISFRRKQPAGGGSAPDSGVAAVGLGVAAVVTTLDASGQEADAHERRKGCQPSSDCDASEASEVNAEIETAYADAGSKRNVALVMGVAGVGALAAAVRLWTADSGADASAAGAAGWGLVPIALPMTQGISLHASF